MVEKVHKFSSHCPSVYFGIGKKEKPMKVEEKNFHIYKTCFFLNYFKTLLSKLITFSIFLHFNDLNCFRSATFSSINNLGTITTIEQHKRKFFGVQELVVVCCFEFLTPPTLGAHNFLIFNPFSQFLMPQTCQEKGFNIFLDTKNKRALPLNLNYPKHLSVLKPT